MEDRNIIYIPVEELHAHPDNSRKDVGDVSDKLSGVLGIPLADLVDAFAEVRPSVEVEKIKHSRWLPSPDGVNPIICKECNAPALYVYDEDNFGDRAFRRYKSKYCPYCGAKMDGGNT